LSLKLHELLETEQKQEKKPVFQALIDYLRKYYSVGVLRIFLDLEKLGYARGEVEAALKILLHNGLVEYREIGCYNFLPELEKRIKEVFKHAEE